MNWREKTSSFYQIGGIVRVESRRYWRRRGLPLIMLLWLIGILLSGWLQQGLVSQVTQENTLFAESTLFKRTMTTNGLLMGTGTLSAIFAIFVLTIIVSDTISHDKQLGVMEWLHALPLNLATYLIGKLCGMWVSILTVMLLVMSVGGAGYVLLFGKIDAYYYFYLWAGIGAMALLVTGIGMLVTAGFSSRRKAMFAGLITAVICFFLFMPGYVSFIWNINQAYLEQFAPKLRAEYCRIDPTNCNETAPPTEEEPLELPISLPTFTLTLLRGGIILIVAWLGAWRFRLWQLKKER